MRAYLVLVLSLALMGAAGCGEDETTAPTQMDPVGNNDGFPDDDDDDVDDTPEADPAEPDVVVEDPPRCGEPGEPYGTSEGSRFFPFTLDTCAGEPYEFYGEEEGYCDARFTVLSIGAGWCGPCRIEAELMQENLVELYSDRGVRVIVALIQDNEFGAADESFCDGWVNQYGLTNPVLVDPIQETGIYFPGGALPSTLIVDSEGVIVHREYGVSDELITVRARLDELLAGE